MLCCWSDAVSVSGTRRLPSEADSDSNNFPLEKHSNSIDSQTKDLGSSPSDNLRRVSVSNVVPLPNTDPWSSQPLRQSSSGQEVDHYLPALPASHRCNPPSTPSQRLLAFFRRAEPLGPQELNSSSEHFKAQGIPAGGLDPCSSSKYRKFSDTIKKKVQGNAPILYVIGQLSSSELNKFLADNKGAILVVQGLPGFNVVDTDEKGELSETNRNVIDRMCADHDCLLLNLTSHDCLKIGFNQLYELFDTSMPPGPQRDLLFSYRSSSFGSFAASVSRGKIKVDSEDGAATDGLIRSVDVTIGETVDKLRNFEMKLYRDALELCKNDPEKQDIFNQVLQAVKSADSTTPEAFLTSRTRGFGIPEAFVQLRNKCSTEITQAAYQPGGVLNGCMTPVYDDWTVHQTLRILSGKDPLGKMDNRSVDLHLQFTASCLKYVFDMIDRPNAYAVELFSLLRNERHTVLHDIGSDTGPDDYPASVMLMALVKFRQGNFRLNLYSVGGEAKYRALRNSLMQHMSPKIEGVEMHEAPFIKGASIISPFVPVALVQTIETLETKCFPYITV